MKKQLLSTFAAVAVSTVFAQTPSPSWATSQNAGFPVISAGIKFMDAVDANVVWTIGYDGMASSRNYNWFSRSTNGGSTFTSGNVFPDTLNYVIANMEAIDANTAWVCAFQRTAPYSTANQGGGVIYRTTNGGTSWQNMTAAGMLTNTAQSFANFVSFLTPSVGIFVGDPINGSYEIWRTINGGSSWSPVPAASIPAPSSSTEFAITNLYCKQGNSNLWYGTNEGRVFSTHDAGLTWNAHSVTVPSTTITQVTFATPLMGIVYARNAGNNNEVYNTTDGGVTWTQIVSLSPNMGFNDIKAIPGTTYFASVDNQNNLISYSTDNGVTWTSWGSTGIPYLTLDFANATAGWAGSFSDQTDATTGGVWKFTGTLTLGQIPPTSAFVVAPQLCGPNATASITNNSTGTAPLTYTWSSAPAGVAFSSTSAAAPVLTFTANNSYTITLTTVASGSTNVSSQVVDVIACSAPTGSFTLPATACNLVSFTTTTTGTAGTPAASHLWTASPSAGVTFSPSAAVPSPSVKVVTPGTYTITYVTANLSGSVSATQVITVADCKPVPTFTMRAGVCKPDTINAANTSANTAGTGVNSYTWSVAPLGGVVQTNTNAPTPQSKRFIFNNSNTYTITLKASNTSGTATATQIITVDACVGIAENSSLANHLTVYPNPAHDVLNVSLTASDNASVKLLNVLGAVVYEEKLNRNTETMTINLAGKAKGVYFLNVEANGEKVTRKIIID